MLVKFVVFMICIGTSGSHVKSAIGGTFATIICFEVVSVDPSLSVIVNVAV